MRVVFMGTPDFAVSSLQALIDHQYEICGVVTQPDKPKGRGHKLLPPPVKDLALSCGIPVFQPTSLKTEEAVEQLRVWAPDVIIVVAYGKILPVAILNLPPKGCINVHGSLLPKYRGAAPIQWAVINGEAVTGVTTMYMAQGMDTGDILLQSELPVGRSETAGELFDRLKETGAALLLETLQAMESGTLVRTAQREDDATLAPMLSKELAELCWKQPAEKLRNLIRGLNPWPVAYTWLEGKKLKVFEAQYRDGSFGEPGRIQRLQGELLVSCGEGGLLLTDIQAENGKRMSGKSYLLGHSAIEGATLGERPETL